MEREKITRVLPGLTQVPVVACVKCTHLLRSPEDRCMHPDCFRVRVSEGRDPITGEYRRERVMNFTELNRDCSCSRFEGETMSRRERNLKAAGPSTPVLEDEVAEEFLETVDRNRIRKVPKSSFDRAQRTYKNFTKPDNGI